MGAISTMPLSMAFLVMDRIFVLRNPNLSQSQFRLWGQVISVFVLILNFCFIFHLMFWRSYSPEQETTTCMTLACLIFDKVKDIVIYKMCIGVCNIVFGFYFIYIFYRYRKKLSGRREKRVCFFNVFSVFSNSENRC